jgi:homoserine O-acetyltransferase/O-succinyltransferase
VHALNAAAAAVGFVEVESDKGHDAFLLDEPALFAAAQGFIDAAARQRGI